MNQDKAPRRPSLWSCWTDPSGTLAQVKESARVKATTVWPAPTAMLSHLSPPVNAILRPEIQLHQLFFLSPLSKDLPLQPKNT